MHRFLGAAMAAGLLLSGFGNARADELPVVTPKAKIFVTLPYRAILPEGIAVNPANGDIYVGTFASDNWLLRFAANGKLIAKTNTGPEPLLGLAFEPVSDMLYIANVGVFAGGTSRIQRIAADLDPYSLENVADIPTDGVGAPPSREVANPDGSTDVITFGNNVAVPNALAFDAAGNLYVSDSFQGAIFRVNNATGCAGPADCTVDTVIHDGLLATAGHPPFGANGLALGPDGSSLFIANTGDDRVLKLDLDLVTLSIFAESLNGADGIAFDDAGRLWVAANQADRVIGLDAAGKPVAELGRFEGIDEEGRPRGLLFPASLAIHGGQIYVTNLAIALTPAVGDEWEEEVTSYTVSRIPVPDGN